MSAGQGSSGPHAPRTWMLGGEAVKRIDIPIDAVFLALFVLGAVTHMTIFQLNRRRKHWFVFSAVTFGFCMARIVTLSLRIAAVCKPNNVRLAIASQIFTAAGVVVLFVIHLFYSQRILRACHPRLGWHPVTGIFFKFCVFWCIGTIVVLITVVIQSYYTTSPNNLRIDRDALLYGVTAFAVISFLPIPITILAIITPRSGGREIDSFGEGSWTLKPIILLTASTLICFGASYRAGTSWDPGQVPLNRPMPQVLGKAPFYIANFTVEILTVFLYAVTRVDKRFYVPDKAGRHRSYRKAAEAAALAAASEPKDSPESEAVNWEAEDAVHPSHKERESLDLDPSEKHLGSTDVDSAHLPFSSATLAPAGPHPANTQLGARMQFDPVPQFGSAATFADGYPFESAEWNPSVETAVPEPDGHGLEPGGLAIPMPSPYAQERARGEGTGPATGMATGHATGMATGPATGMATGTGTGGHAPATGAGPDSTTDPHRPATPHGIP